MDLALYRQQHALSSTVDLSFQSDLILSDVVYSAQNKGQPHFWFPPIQPETKKHILAVLRERPITINISPVPLGSALSGMANLCSAMSDVQLAGSQ